MRLTLARDTGKAKSYQMIFIDDARNEWHKLLEVANNRIAAAQNRINESGEELVKNAEALDKAVKMVLRECVNSTNQSAQELDKRIAENLTSQASVLGGHIEPAATLWRVLRGYPTKDRVVDPNFGPRGLRCFQSIAPASIAVLAIDRELPIATRQVLSDLLSIQLHNHQTRKRTRFINQTKRSPSNRCGELIAHHARNCWN